MQKLVLVGLLLTLTNCSRAVVPAVPEAFDTAADATPGTGPKKGGTVYTGENGTIGGISGTLPSGSETDPLTNGGTGLPTMTDPVVMMPEIPQQTDPKPIPGDTTGGQTNSFRTLSVSPLENRGIWEGFGANLGPWANVVGASDFQDTYADVLFTQKNTAFTNTVIPGLGLNIVRYGLGGSGRAGDSIDQTEGLPMDLAPFRDMDGFWINNESEDPLSLSFDWTRDANQRSLMTAAKERGLTQFEIYSAAPMWWMTAEKTAFGGKLENASVYAKYLATVVKYAQDEWSFPVASLAPFNEPTSDRWKAGDEQGTLFAGLEQKALLLELEKEFAARGLKETVGLAGSDEATPRAALNMHDELKRNGIDLYEKINVHSSDRGRPSRDLAAKQGLRISAGEKRIWVSDHSDLESDGMSLAQSIVEDIHAMKATAWIYGQPVDTMSTKGLLLANFDMTDLGTRGQPQAISIKHYILAQFSRFIRPGQQIVGGNDDKSLIAYDPTTHRLSVIILNSSKMVQDVDIDLSAFKSWSTSISHVVTRGDGMKVWKAKSVGVLSRKVRVSVEAGSVSSLEIPDAILK